MPSILSSSIDDALFQVDCLSGHEFEYFCAELLKKNGFHFVTVTKGSGDQGVDIIATKDHQRYSFQCKHYSSRLGNKPVQEVNAGRSFYKCDVAVVLTNSSFTKGAYDLARVTNVQLWDRSMLTRLMRNAVSPSRKMKPNVFRKFIWLWLLLFSIFIGVICSLPTSANEKETIQQDSFSPPTSTSQSSLEKLLEIKP